MVASSALMGEKADKDQQVAEVTMLTACLCQCDPVPNAVVSDTVPNTVAMGFEDLATCYQEGLNLMVANSEEDPEVQQEAEMPDKAHISQVVLDKDLHPHHPHSHYHPEECYTHPVCLLVEQQVYIQDNAYLDILGIMSH